MYVCRHMHIQRETTHLKTLLITFIYCIWHMANTMLVGDVSLELFIALSGTYLVHVPTKHFLWFSHILFMSIIVKCALFPKQISLLSLSMYK